MRRAGVLPASLSENSAALQSPANARSRSFRAYDAGLVPEPAMIEQDCTVPSA
jgi:hypothetical protein